MAKRIHDPVKDHAYYERTKHLKGRHKGTSKAAPHDHTPKRKAARERVVRLKGYVSTIKKALSETEAELSKKRQTAQKTAKANSDGKTTVAERQASKQYRDKHQQKLKATSSSSSSGSANSSGGNSSGSAKSSGGSSSRASSKSVSDMNAQLLRARATELRSMLRDARKQLSDATKELGQLAHSELMSDPNVNDKFARFQSAERIPSR